MNDARVSIGPGATLLVDEAGQISGRQMAELFALDQKHNCRLILSGDTRQHGAIGAIDSLRVLEVHTSTCRVELKSIRRKNSRLGQTPEEIQKIQTYKRAVWLASNGKAGDSLRKIQQNGWVLEETDEVKLYANLEQHYLRSIAEKEQVLVISQTKDSVQQLNLRLRELYMNPRPRRLQIPGFGEGAQAKPPRTIQTFQLLDHILAEKQDWKTYHR